MYNLAMEFEGLKLRTKSFKFSSKKKYNDFFNDALIDSPLQFIRLSKQEFDEKIHIAFSWMILTKVISWFLIGLSAILILAHVPWMLSLALVVFSFISMFASKIFNTKVEDLALGKSFVIGAYEMNNYENLEEVRQELIAEKSK
jgi:hypothetical protein